MVKYGVSIEDSDTDADNDVEHFEHFEHFEHLEQFFTLILA